jgi:hypothetical protein
MYDTLPYNYSHMINVAIATHCQYGSFPFVPACRPPLKSSPGADWPNELCAAAAAL